MKGSTVRVSAAVAVGLLSIGFIIKIVAGTNNLPPLIPIPKEFHAEAGQFNFGAGTRVMADAVSRPAAELLANRLRLINN